MRRILAFLLPAAAIVAVGIAFAATGGSSHSATASSSITVYSGQHPESVTALVAAFEKQSGIDVKVRHDDEGALTAQIIQEGSHSPADVVYTENSPPLEALQARGLLARVNAATLAKTSAKYSSAKKQWAAVSGRVSVIIYNTGLVKPAQLPRSVLELAKPAWKGKVALSPGEADFAPIVTAVVARYGKTAALKWLQGIKSNASGHLYPDNESLVAQVNSGQVELGVVNNYYWFRLRDEIGKSKIHSAEGFFAPGDPGYVIDISGAAVLASSSHQADAQKFVAFLVSRSGQEILARDQTYEYPLASGVVTKKLPVPFAKLKPDPITVSRLGDGQLAITLLRAANLL